jgi:hypothetical protein
MPVPVPEIAENFTKKIHKLRILRKAKKIEGITDIDGFASYYSVPMAGAIGTLAILFLNSALI